MNPSHDPVEVCAEAVRAVEQEYEITLGFRLEIGKNLQSAGLIKIKE